MQRTSVGVRRLLGTAATLLVLVSCGTSSGRADVDAEVDRATAPADGERSTDGTVPGELIDAVDATLAIVRFDLEASLALVAGDESLSIAVTGAFDFEDGVIDAGFLIGQGDETGTLDMRSDGTDLWVRPDGMFEAPPDGATWVVGSFDDLGVPAGLSSESTLGIVLVLRSGVDAEDLGDRQVRGQSTRLWSFETTYDQALAAAGDDAAAFERALNIDGAGGAPLAVDVWVGDDGIVRQLAMQIGGSDLPIAGAYDLVLTSVGEPFAPPQPPPAEEVLDRERSTEVLAALFG